MEYKNIGSGGKLSGGFIDTNGLNDVYKDLCDCVGVENMLKIYARYRGSQVTFPQRIFSSEYVKRRVREKFDGTNLKQLAREYDYSEKWIRQMIKQEEK